MTPPVTLRPVTPADAPAIAAGLGDWEVVKWTAKVPHPFSQADVKLANDDGSPLWPEMAVIEVDGVCAGMIRVDGRIGYWIARPHWGRGIAGQAARQAVAAFFARAPGATEITACVYEGNPASSRILARLGFVETGRSTGWCTARGQTLPQIEYSLTRAAWEGGR